VLDNLVFYYSGDIESFEKLNEYIELHEPYSQKITLIHKPREIRQKAVVYLRSGLSKFRYPVWLSNFYTFHKANSFRAIPLQIQWYSLVFKENWSEGEIIQIKDMKRILENAEIEPKSYHFELTIAIGTSELIFQNIVRPLIDIGFKIIQLQPDNEQILYRDKFSLWHLIDETRRVVIKGYVMNDNRKYPPPFRNLTKVELLLPTINFNDWESIMKLLKVSQDLRLKLCPTVEAMQDISKIILDKTTQAPVIYPLSSNAMLLGIQYNQILNFIQENFIVDPFPCLHVYNEEAYIKLIEILNERLDDYFEQKYYEFKEQEMGEGDK